MSLKKMNCFGLCQLTIKFKRNLSSMWSQGEDVISNLSEMCAQSRKMDQGLTLILSFSIWFYKILVGTRVANNIFSLASHWWQISFKFYYKLIQAKAIHFLRLIFLKHDYTRHLFKTVLVAEDLCIFKSIVHHCSKF